jgi:PPM family protein phosphatase
LRFSIFQDSLLGGRKVNQDRMGYSYTRDTLLMVVADGMGGHAQGEVAAQLSLTAMGHYFQSHVKTSIDDPSAFLDAGFRKAHRDILRYYNESQLPESPRTTLVAAVVQHGKVWWAHSGDSRFYLLRGNRAHSRTLDHSKVQTLVNLGLIEEGEQHRHPERNKVLNCLGSPIEPTVEIGGPENLLPGDVLMLCSDGVWSALGDIEVCTAFARTPVNVAVPRLVQMAIDREGDGADNTTALAMQWEGDDALDTQVSSGEMPDGAVTTTIGHEAADFNEAASDLSDDEIEQTIREIKAAIERSDPSPAKGGRHNELPVLANEVPTRVKVKP